MTQRRVACEAAELFYFFTIIIIMIIALLG